MPPVAKKVPKELTTHGHTRIDNYYWMNKRENLEVISHLEAENAYKDSAMKHTKPLQEKLYDEIKSKIKQKDESVPYKKDGYYYNFKQLPGKEYDINCRKKGSLKGEEEVILDENILAVGHEYFAVGGMSVSTNNNILAYGVDMVSRRKYTIHFKNLEIGGSIIRNGLVCDGGING